MIKTIILLIAPKRCSALHKQCLLPSNVLRYIPSLQDILCRRSIHSGSKTEAAVEAKKEEEGGDGAEREAESPRTATEAKKKEKERMRLVESLSDPYKIQQGGTLGCRGCHSSFRTTQTPPRTFPTPLKSCLL